MRVPARQAAGMLDADKISVPTTVPTGKCDRSVCNCNNRATRRHGVISGQMHPFSAEDRMHPARCETGADAWRELQRRCQDGALQGNTLLVVIRILESKARVMAAGVYQISRLDLSVLHEGAVVQKFVDDQPDLIACLNLRAEINLPLEDFRQFRGEVLAPGQIRESLPKRRVDLGRNYLLARFEIELLDFRLVGFRAFLHSENTFLVDFVFEGLQSAIGLLFEAEWIAETHFAKIEDGTDVIGDVIGDRDGNVVVH